jgi:hypothetical protein
MLQRPGELHRYWTTRDRATNVRLYRLAAEVLAAVDAGVFPPRVSRHCQDCPVRAGAKRGVRFRLSALCGACGIRMTEPHAGQRLLGCSGSPPSYVSGLTASATKGEEPRKRSTPSPRLQ